uniref:hypothetical protein n=1 Tax=Streptococcus agalactiae TaxID=1311 RepID=UPI001C406AD4
LFLFVFTQDILHYHDFKSLHQDTSYLAIYKTSNLTFQIVLLRYLLSLFPEMVFKLISKTQ